MNDVTIIAADGGLGRKDFSEDMISGLMTTGVAVGGGLTLNTTYELKQITDLENLLVTAAYDTTNKTLIHYHVSEFFRLNPSGTIFLRVAAQATTMAQLATNTLTHAKQLLIDAQGKVKQLAISINPASGYTPTLSGGLNADVLAAIPLAQVTVVAEFAAKRPVQVILEGRNYNGTSASATDLRTLTAKGVSVCIGQDNTIAALDALHAGHACIGTVLGIISAAKVNENIGWLAKFNIQSKATGEEKFLLPYLSSNLALSTYSDTSIDQLNTKGYIFPVAIVDWEGLYFNDSHTCEVITSDYYCIEQNRVINKAARLIRKRVLPFLNGPIKVNASTGQLPQSFCKYLEAEAEKALNAMFEADEISERKCYVDPAQNILTTSKTKIKFRVVPTGTNRAIEVEIGFATSF